MDHELPPVAEKIANFLGVALGIIEFLAIVVLFAVLIKIGVRYLSRKGHDYDKL